METSKKNQFDFGSYKWSKLDLVRSDQNTSFVCPSCGSKSHFSHIVASSKNPKTTGQLQPMNQSARLTNGFALFFNQIYDRQPLIRGLTFVIGITTAMFLIWFWQQTIWDELGPWVAFTAAFFGGWIVMRLVQPTISPKLPLWRFNCADCGAGYVLATNGTQARVGDNKGRIIDDSINSLPIVFECPECKTEFELDEKERKVKQFSCPNCNKFVDLREDSDKNKK